MNQHKLKALYGLKWNPFIPNIPLQALQVTVETKLFCDRISDLASQGGFAAILAEPGQGKSCILRLIYEQLGSQQNVAVKELTRSQASLNDFYRQVCELFGVSFNTFNRFDGYQALKNKWRQHIENTQISPVILLDEAQALQGPVLTELKSLYSERFDSRALITVVLAGDMRLANLLENHKDFQPINSRLRHRLVLQNKTPSELESFLSEAIKLAGAPALMTSELIRNLAHHSLGNLRSLMILANECLTEAAKKEIRFLDESIYLDLTKTNTLRKQDRAKKTSI